MCFQFSVKPQEECADAAAEAQLRCCGENNLQKLKMYVGKQSLDCSLLIRWYARVHTAATEMWCLGVLREHTWCAVQCGLHMRI